MGVRVGVLVKVIFESGMMRKFFSSRPEIDLVVVLSERVMVTGWLALGDEGEVLIVIMGWSVVPDARWRMSWFWELATRKRIRPMMTGMIGRRMRVRRRGFILF